MFNHQSAGFLVTKLKNLNKKSVHYRKLLSLFNDLIEFSHSSSPLFSLPSFLNPCRNLMPNMIYFLILQSSLLIFCLISLSCSIYFFCISSRYCFFSWQFLCKQHFLHKPYEQYGQSVCSHLLSCYGLRLHLALQIRETSRLSVSQFLSVAFSLAEVTFADF